MRIDAGHSYPLAAQQPKSSAATHASAAFATLMASTPGDATQTNENGSTSPDFTSMTRKELFDWMNNKITSGEMSLDDSTAFLGMTVRIPVGSSPGTAITLDDRERVDFVQKAQDGLAGATYRHDQMSRKMLTTALSIMHNYQGQAIDRRA